MGAFQHRELPYAAFVIRADGRGFIWNWGLEPVDTPVETTLIDTATYYPTDALYLTGLYASYDEIEAGGIVS